MRSIIQAKSKKTLFIRKTSKKFCFQKKLLHKEYKGDLPYFKLILKKNCRRQGKADKKRTAVYFTAILEVLDRQSEFLEYQSSVVPAEAEIDIDGHFGITLPCGIWHAIEVAQWIREFVVDGRRNNAGLKSFDTGD